MGSFEDIRAEVADNWPAFVYIMMTLVFSFLFFRQRRRETRLVREIGEGIRESICSRLDHLEALVQNSIADRNRHGQTDRETKTVRAGFSS